MRTFAGAAMSAFLLAIGTAPAVAQSTCPQKNRPNDLRLVAGSPQSAMNGTQFETSLQVALANRNGCPLTGSLSGVSVRFGAPGDGASGTFAASGSNEVTVGTDDTGAAAASAFTANDTEGEYEVRAESRYGTVTFHLTNTATGVAASIAATGPTEQSATVNRPYAQPLEVRVVDAHGAPVRAVTVTFSLATGPSGAGGSFLGGGAQTTAPTDSAGRATSPVVVANGTAGRFAATATASGLSGTVIFNLDNHAAVYTLTTPNRAARTATVNSRYAAPLQAQVLDESGQPLEGIAVTFSLGSGPSGAAAAFLGGGTQATATTDATGVAASPLFVANAAPGRFTATAGLPGSAAPLSFSLRNLPGTLTAAGRTQTATVNTTFPHRLRARMVGARRRPLEGVTVTFTIAKAGSGAAASFADGSSQATATTGAAGWAISPPLLANNVAGRFAAHASAASAGKPVAYTLRNVPGRAASVSAGAASGQSTAAGSRFPIPLAVTVLDADKNPVAGITVTFTAPAHGASGRFAIAKPRRHASRIARVKTSAKGIAIAPAFTANHEAGGYVVTVAAGGQRTGFALVNAPATER